MHFLYPGEGWRHSIEEEEQGQQAEESVRGAGALAREKESLGALEEVKVDRTSNRAWKRRRNWIALTRELVNMNRDRGGIFKSLMAGRPDANREKARRMIREIFEMRRDE